MGKPQFQFDVTLTQIDCGECGGVYAINERYREQQYKKGGTWTCPYCKIGWGYSNNNENAKLKKELEEAQRRVEWHRNNAASERSARERSERSNRALRGATTRIRNRIKNGVCPCCSRTFIDLQRHMSTKHPDFKPTHVITDPSATV